MFGWAKPLKHSSGNTLVADTWEQMPFPLSLTAVLFGVPVSEQHGSEPPAPLLAESEQSSVAEANIKIPASCMHLRCRRML